MTYADLVAAVRLWGSASMNRRDLKVATTESAVNVKEDGTFIKYDAGKARFDLLQPLALTAVAKVLAHGATKYTPNNWRKGAAWSRYYGAMQRHLNAWWAGEALDKETGLSHLAHAACCLMFLQSYEIEKLGTDDRPCCCGAPNDTQAKHGVDACIGRDSAVGMTATDVLRRIEEQREKPFYRPSAPVPPRGPLIERISNAEGQEATSKNRRLVPSDNSELVFNGYRYENAAGRVAYIVAIRRMPSTRTAIGSAVLQPGDTEDRAIGLQIAVGQALKNLNRGRFFGASPYVMHLATRFPHMPVHIANAYQTLLPPLAELEIERADQRKRYKTNNPTLQSIREMLNQATI